MTFINGLSSTPPSKLKELRIPLEDESPLIVINEILSGLATALAHNTHLERLYCNYYNDDDETII